MAKHAHNKKRNVGLIHEQLVRYIASALIANDSKTAKKATQIIKRHFAKGTELYKEFRLFNALINVPVGSPSISERVINESKKAALSHNSQQLRKEKSQLIKEINHSLLDSHRLYDVKIENYKLYATVQTLLNEWRGTNKLDITTKALYEQKVSDWLSRPLNEKKDEPIEDISPLVRNLMFKKFDEKYRDVLNEGQKRLLENAIFSSDEDFSQIVQKVKKDALRTLLEFKKTCDNVILKQEIDVIVEKAESLRESKSDEVIGKVLQLTQLIEEILSDE